MQPSNIRSSCTTERLDLGNCSLLSAQNYCCSVGDVHYEVVRSDREGATEIFHLTLLKDKVGCICCCLLDADVNCLCYYLLGQSITAYSDHAPL